MKKYLLHNDFHGNLGTIIPKTTVTEEETNTTILVISENQWRKIKRISCSADCSCGGGVGYPLYGENPDGGIFPWGEKYGNN